MNKDFQSPGHISIRIPDLAAGNKPSLSIPLPPGPTEITPIPGAPPQALRGFARRNAVLNLVNRITQGFNATEYRHAEELGYEAYLEEQLDYQAIDDTETEARVAALSTIDLPASEIFLTHHDVSEEIPFWELKSATIIRSVHSKRQLFERMCEFWSDHFSIHHERFPQWALKPVDDIAVIRTHALGNFPDMLRASAHSAAMLFYLDNYLNFAGAPQENYSRELMELHTLGVNGGFTETDVREVARCLTGWTIDTDSDSPTFLESLFVSEFHANGAKTVLGQTIPAFPPRQQLNRVIDLLAMHPSTARFISLKMTRWFLREDPPENLVDQVAQTYLDTSGDIKAMLRVILARPNLAPGSTSLAPKFKRPLHFVYSLLRGCDLEVNEALYLNFFLFTMGHSPFGWPAPDGFPDSVNNWGDALLPRWNFASALMTRGTPGSLNPPGVPGINGLLAIPFALQQDGVEPHIRLARRINQRILGSALSLQEVAQVQEYIDSLVPLTSRDIFEAIALAASAPSYQWY